MRRKIETSSGISLTAGGESTDAMFFPGQQCVPNVSTKAETSVHFLEFRGESMLLNLVAHFVNCIIHVLVR